MLKRFLAFRGDQYYPSSGMGDFVGDFDTQEEAIGLLTADRPTYLSWGHKWGVVWDSETRSDVWDDYMLPSNEP